MGKAKDDLSYDKQVEADWAIFVPTGWWHNVTNTGDEPLKVYSIYAPSHHPHGTVHATKADADAAEQWLDLLTHLSIGGRLRACSAAHVAATLTDLGRG